MKVLLRFIASFISVVVVAAAYTHTLTRNERKLLSENVKMKESFKGNGSEYNEM